MKSTHEYHLICLATGTSHGGFRRIEGARQYANEEQLERWQIFEKNRLVEMHDPDQPDPVQRCKR